jgi:histone H3/H4
MRRDTRDTRDTKSKNDRSGERVDRVERVTEKVERPRQKSSDVQEKPVARPQTAKSPNRGGRRLIEVPVEFPEVRKGSKQTSPKIVNEEDDHDDEDLRKTEEEHHEVEEYDEHYDEHRDDHNDDKDDELPIGRDDSTARTRRQPALIPKAVVAKLISEAGISGVSSDVHTYVIQEIQNFIRQVIRSLEEEADGDGLVIKESYLRFLGDKSRASGVLDLKSFEKVYSITSEEMNVNPEFSSSAFSAFCKYAEIHVVDFLKKAQKLVQNYGRKRLSSKDLDLLKEMLN